MYPNSSHNDSAQFNLLITLCWHFKITFMWILKNFKAISCMLKLFRERKQFFDWMRAPFFGVFDITTSSTRSHGESFAIILKLLRSIKGRLLSSSAVRRKMNQHSG